MTRAQLVEDRVQRDTQRRLLLPGDDTGHGWMWRSIVVVVALLALIGMVTK